MVYLFQATNSSRVIVKAAEENRNNMLHERFVFYHTIVGKAHTKLWKIHISSIILD